VGEAAPGLFEPERFYGDTNIWTLNIGARIGVGIHHARMGRYGVAAPVMVHDGSAAAATHDPTQH
jgi:hypothetical protein